MSKLQQYLDRRKNPQPGDREQMWDDNLRRKSRGMPTVRPKKMKHDVVVAWIDDIAYEVAYAAEREINKRAPEMLAGRSKADIDDIHEHIIDKIQEVVREYLRG